jgi:hypothetical protein
MFTIYFIQEEIYRCKHEKEKKKFYSLVKKQGSNNGSQWNEGKRCITGSYIRSILYFQQNISEKNSNISRKLLSLSIGVTKVNFMWCIFHNAQFYDIDLIINAKRHKYI